MSLIGEGMELFGLFDKAKNADLYKQLGDWIDKVRILQSENESLLAELKESKERLRFKETLQRINGHTFVEGEDEEICPRCAVIDGVPMYIMQRSRGLRVMCPQCKLEMPHHYPKTRAAAQNKNLSPGVG